MCLGDVCIAKSEEFYEPKSFNDAIKCPNSESWKLAMQEEIDSLNKNCTWDLVKVPVDGNVVGCKWTYKIKRCIDGKITRHKVRLVAQGFTMKCGHNYDEVFASVARHSTLRILLSTAGEKKLRVTSRSCLELYIE